MDELIKRILDSGAPIPLGSLPDGGATFIADIRHTSTGDSLAIRVEPMTPSGRSIAVDYDLATRNVRIVDCTGLLLAPHDETWLIAELRRRHAILLERVRRDRRGDDRHAWRNVAWSTLAHDEMVAYHEVFPLRWDLVERVGTEWLWLADQHCSKAGCSCSKVVLVLKPLKSSEPVGAVEIDLGPTAPVTVVRSGGAIAMAVSRYLRDDPELVDRLRYRVSEMRRVRRRLATRVTDLTDPTKLVNTVTMIRLDADAIDRVTALGAPALEICRAITGTLVRLRNVAILRGHLGDETITAELEQLVERNLGDAELQQVGDALIALGKAAIDPLLHRFERTPSATSRMALMDVASDLEIHDARILAALGVELRSSPAFYANLIAKYDDRAALPILQLVTLELLAERHDDGDADLLALAEGIEALGGELTTDHDQRRVAILAARACKRTPSPRSEIVAARSAPARTPVSTNRAPTRNEPCWCGSNRKYKKCHLDEDAAADASRR